MLKNFNRVITAAFAIALLVILIFFRQCELDLYALILALAVVAMAAYTSYRQVKRLKELKGEDSSN